MSDQIATIIKLIEKEVKRFQTTNAENITKEEHREDVIALVREKVIEFQNTFEANLRLRLKYEKNFKSSEDLELYVLVKTNMNTINIMENLNKELAFYIDDSIKSISERLKEPIKEKNLKE